MRFRRLETAFFLAVLVLGFLSAELHDIDGHHSVRAGASEHCEGCTPYPDLHLVSGGDADHPPACNTCFFQKLLSSPLPATTADEPALPSRFDFSILSFPVDQRSCYAAVNRGPPAC